MISKTYEGNKSLKGITKVTDALKMKIRRIGNRFDDEKTVTLIAGEYYGGDMDIRFLYFKHDILVQIRDGVVTVYEFDYYGGYFWAYEAREIGKFQF